MAKGNPQDSLAFDPVGAHSSGATISSATTITVPTGATKILIQAITKNVRFTLDGTTPTTSVGFLLTAGDQPLLIPLGNATTLKVIEAEATASLQYQFGV